jgi:hypothetical protein
MIIADRASGLLNPEFTFSKQLIARNRRSLLLLVISIALLVQWRLAAMCLEKCGRSAASTFRNLLLTMLFTWYPSYPEQQPYHVEVEGGKLKLTAQMYKLKGYDYMYLFGCEYGFRYHLNLNKDFVGKKF